MNDLSPWVAFRNGGEVFFRAEPHKQMGSKKPRDVTRPLTKKQLYHREYYRKNKAKLLEQRRRRREALSKLDKLVDSVMEAQAKTEEDSDEDYGSLISYNLPSLEDILLPKCVF